MVTIVILAMVAAFVALRLYTVLGRRTGHEQQPLPPRPVENDRSVQQTQRAEPISPPSPENGIGGEAGDGVRALIAADPSFDVGRFLEGAKSAYRMALEAYWKGDEEALAKLSAPDVLASFAAAIAQRASDGHVLENRLVRIETATIDTVRMENKVAFVTVRFDADVATVTRDAEGNVVAGSLTDAVPTHDLWTFSRNVRDSDPNWLLVETDDVE